MTTRLYYEELTSQEKAKALYQEYEVHFSGDQSRYPHDQMNYDLRSFLEACQDTSILKFTFEVNGEIAGFALLTKPGNLHKAPWVSPKFYGDETIYITLLMTTRAMRGSGHARQFLDQLIEAATELYPSSDYGFDMPEEKGFLSRLIIERVNQVGMDGDKVGSQEYFRIGPKPT